MSRVQTLCRGWRLIRRDGVIFGFTDHDRDIEIGGVIYAAYNGMSAGAVDSRIGFSADSGHVQGVLSDDRITAQDIRAGLYADARLEALEINWQTLESSVLQSGYIGEITQQGESFLLDWTGEAAKLERSVGRVFSRRCDAEFGDARCGLSLVDFPDGTECPRSFDACQAQFSNSANFRGFPYLLGDDALTAAPKEGEVFDGGSRYNGNPDL